MGVAEELKGKAKQAVGDLTDNEALKTEGEAQSAKGAEERKETEANAKAQAHEKKADCASPSALRASLPVRSPAASFSLPLVSSKTPMSFSVQSYGVRGAAVPASGPT